MRLSKKPAALIGAFALSLGLAACGSTEGESTTTAEGSTESEVAESTYPEKDITFIVHAAAGGGSDLASRTLATQLEEILGVSIVVENRTGGSGSVAMEYMAEQDPDGYTIGFAPVEIAMLGHMGYSIDPDNYDFLGQIMNGPAVLAVPADSPYETIEEFVEAAKSGEELTVANGGVGGIWDVSTTGFAREAGITLTNVPFDGGAGAVAAAVGSQVDAVVAGAGEIKQSHVDGTLRALTVMSAERLDDLSDVPTAEESGYDITMGGWGGVYAPKGLSDDVKAILADAIEQGVTSDTFIDTISAAGNVPMYTTPDEFTAFVDSEYERFGELLSE